MRTRNDECNRIEYGAETLSYVPIAMVPMGWDGFWIYYYVIWCKIDSTTDDVPLRRRLLSRLP